MIVGIGTDIVEINRIEDKLSRSEYFKEHVYSATEIAYCEKQKNPYISFAARWAVKEAYLKAFGLKFIGNHKLAEIETLNDEDGKPHINLLGKSLIDFEEKQLGAIHVSISHTPAYATAYVIIESKTT